MPTPAKSPWVDALVALSPTASPTALAPLLEMRPFRAEGRVVAVPGIDPGPVGQRPEDLLLEAVHQAGECVRVVEGVARTAGEQAVAGEQMRCVRELAVRVVQQRDRPRRVPYQVDGPQAGVADPDDVAVVHELLGRHRQWASVVG